MKLTHVLHFLGWAGLFGLAYTQAPLYYSNQNQYCLHGLAAVDRGPLHDDWLANTASPTPVFDVLISVTVKYGHEFAFYGYYVLLLGLYWSSLVGLFEHLAGIQATSQRRLAFAAVLMLAHSALLRWASYRLFDADYPCYLQGWLAAQYILGPVFQPSTFGVFLIAGIHQFVRNRPLLAVTCLGLACIGHATYLLPAGILTLTFAGLLVADRRPRQALVIAAAALFLVLPVIFDIAAKFQPTTPEAFAEASRILVEVRIPHHCAPRQWFDAVAGLQVAYVAVAWLLGRRTRLFPIMGVLFISSILLTLIQLATGSTSLALLFPWRNSVVLLPLATMIFATRLVQFAGRWIESTTVTVFSISTIVSVTIAGFGIMASHQSYATNATEEPLMQYVRLNRRPGDLYLLPVTVPNFAGNRGSISGDFKPRRGLASDGRLIPIDYQRFRLAAGVPIYVDFKAIPYRDVDVLEWYQRVQWNAAITEARVVTRSELVARGITHVVVTRDRDFTVEGTKLLFEDDHFRLYGVVP